MGNDSLVSAHQLFIKSTSALKSHQNALGSHLACTILCWVQKIWRTIYLSTAGFSLVCHIDLWLWEESQADGSSDDEDTPEISKWESIIWLLILTALISFLSDYLVNAIEGASDALDIPVAFISVILLPIVGNASEHASAIMFAMKDKLDISLGVAIGSSTQISMFGIPFCVVYAWVLGYPMDLNFQLFETATLFMAVLVVTFMLQEGTSNYFKGLMLLFCYLIVAASYFVHVDPESIRDVPKT